MKGKKFAVIDLGSNSVRMIIMQVYEDYSYKMKDQVKEMVRLSEDMGEEMTLKPLPIKRTLHALKLFKKLIEVNKVDYIFPIATAAVRNAKNQQIFLDRVRNETGFEFCVISGEKEAYYGYMGVINTLQADKCVIVDVGGGSIELVWVEDRKIKKETSLPYGSVILTEKFFGKNHITPDKLKKAELFIEKHLKEIGWLKNLKGYPVVGLGGTVRTISKIDKYKTGFPLASLHNYNMTDKEVYNAYNKAAVGSIEERANIPGVNKERADIIAGGLVPIKCLMEYLQSESLTVSGNGIREGVFYENYLKEQGKEGEIIEDVLFHSVDNILKNYHMNLTHCYHVQKLALSLFDQTKEIHMLGDEERKLLAVSALLHDIGVYIDYYNHHKHGFYMVINARINGLRNRERVVCAFIVAMHREEDFKQDWKLYSMLIDAKDYETIKKLSIFLKIAEKLDRSEYGSIEDVICYVTKDSLQVIVKSNNAPELEIEGALKYQKDFKKLFNQKLFII